MFSRGVVNWQVGSEPLSAFFVNWIIQWMGRANKDSVPIDRFRFKKHDNKGLMDMRLHVNRSAQSAPWWGQKSAATNNMTWHKLIVECLYLLWFIPLVTWISAAPNGRSASGGTIIAGESHKLASSSSDVQSSLDPDYLTYSYRYRNNSIKAL